VTNDRQTDQLAGDEWQHSNDTDTRGSYDDLCVMSLIEDVESSDVQFHSIHMTNRSHYLFTVLIVFV